MRPSLRPNVITAATALFNARGYHNVGMRDIAATLGISVGNLTYHFPKKQDILQAIMEQNFHVTATQEEVTTLGQFQTLLDKMLDSLEVNAFFFQEPSLFPLVDHGDRDVAGLYQITLRALENLQRLGLFQETLSHVYWENISKVLMLSHLGWILKSEPFTPVQGMDRAQFLRAHWSILEPCLTPEGWKQYRQDIEPL